MEWVKEKKGIIWANALHTMFHGNFSILFLFQAIISKLKICHNNNMSLWNVIAHHSIGTSHFRYSYIMCVFKQFVHSLYIGLSLYQFLIIMIFCGSFQFCFRHSNSMSPKYPCEFDFMYMCKIAWNYRLKYFQFFHKLSGHDGQLKKTHILVSKNPDENICKYTKKPSARIHICDLFFFQLIM